MYIKNKKGQSTVEYILLVTAVVAVMIVFVTKQNGGFQGQLNSTLNTATGDMNSLAGVLSDSHQPSPANAVAPANPMNVTVVPPGQ